MRVEGLGKAVNLGQGTAYNAHSKRDKNLIANYKYLEGKVNKKDNQGDASLSPTVCSIPLESKF